MNKQASSFIGTIPEYYDRYLGPRIFHDFADDLAQRVLDLKPGAVLELGAGTGIISRKLRDLLPDECVITATDLNQPMLDVAMAKFHSDEKIKFEVTDATQIPYPEEQFDAVVCQFGVMFFPDKQRSYKEALRILRPGGHYAFNVWGALDCNPFAKIAHETVTEFFPNDPPGFYKVPFGYHDASVIEEAITTAGFSKVKIEEVNIVADIPSATDFATGLVFGNPLFEEIVARGGDPDRVCSAISDALKRELGDNMPLQALVIVAAKD